MTKASKCGGSSKPGGKWVARPNVFPASDQMDGELHVKVIPATRRPSLGHDSEKDGE